MTKLLFNKRKFNNYYKVKTIKHNNKIQFKFKNNKYNLY